VNGILDVQGTATNPVVFTSIKDDSVGGDSNNDGSASSPSGGNWGAIRVLDGGSVTLNYTTVRYGGSYTYSCGYSYCGSYGNLGIEGEA